jgi:hypothetical protein
MLINLLRANLTQTVVPAVLTIAVIGAALGFAFS